MEAVDQLASAGTFRVVKEPLAFLRVLEWGLCLKAKASVGFPHCQIQQPINPAELS